MTGPSLVHWTPRAMSSTLPIWSAFSWPGTEQPADALPSPEGRGFPARDFEVGVCVRRSRTPWLHRAGPRAPRLVRVGPGRVRRPWLQEINPSSSDVQGCHGIRHAQRSRRRHIGSWPASVDSIGMRARIQDTGGWCGGDSRKPPEPQHVRPCTGSCRPDPERSNSAPCG